ncbi:hypothetical protein ASPACDRAFT_43785 [Aspergillus aculeatus ATCC 16872]|uniref:IQ calmodulin-binding motif protein n=1 Tax=Aspergillus aculeatus (strain ATCC 16872 / CBS 172.66 / WB 5094) TaxID=690307 RepID=A0A1L9WSH5_ASPA1|nr:uncharacterized protein ASPACDRAFT_43785 [Aspergillus aculeatus ATCC 16872]OJJ99125.1 hypothetical protein ASPACDRAFT_43785 [Aspergillus aculeatus ATCC 16872]
MSAETIIAVPPPPDQPNPTDRDVTDKEQHAAQTIQRVYRGYRTRRELRGLGLSQHSQNTSRLIEAVKEAEWRQIHRPSAPEDKSDLDSAAHARKNWLRAVSVAKRAGGDDDDDLLPALPDEPASTTTSAQHESRTSTSASNSHGPQIHHDLPAGTTAKMMDLQYFLEMVDLKHRHGSNLRVYHMYWKTSPTQQNFFYWLDHGEGKDLDLPQCPREKLERQQVRYLSREERMNYLVTVDTAGRFRWARNNELVWTDSKRFKDSLHGVVPMEENAPRFKGNDAAADGEASFGASSSSSSSSSLSSLSSSDFSTTDRVHDDTIGKHDTDQYKAAKVAKKFVHTTPATMLNALKGKSSKRKEDMWIFVADTSFRLFVGIKESGAFQHSSFLRGARIAAAGLIKIRNGQLRSLAPLSGHYRPPAANFRAFVHSLQDQGVDMSGVSISKSYAVLLGIEGYTRTKHKVRALHEKADEAKHKLLRKRREKAEAHERGEETINKSDQPGDGVQASAGGAEVQPQHKPRTMNLPIRQKSFPAA